MKKQTEDLMQRVSLFTEMLHHIHSTLLIWHLDTKGNELEAYDKNVRLVLAPFQLGNMIASVQKHIQNSLLRQKNVPPLILSDYLDLMYAAVFPTVQNKVRDFYLIGPAFVHEESPYILSRELDRHQMSTSMKKSVMDLMTNWIPVITQSNLFLFSRMLHHCVNPQAASDSDFPAFARPSENNAINRVTTDDSSYAHYRSEAVLLQKIEEGNLHYKNTYHLISQQGESIQQKNKNISSLRCSKNTALSFISNVTTAAIRGGLPPSTAYVLRETYFDKTEAAENQAQLAHLTHSMYDDFLQRVHQIQVNSSVSRPVRECCEYISLHARERISLANLASQLGYSTYYLSHKFKEEMGISLPGYQTQQKIAQAKLLLTTTAMPIQEISDTLCFCSKSYFSKIFRQKTGLSPGEYRKNPPPA